MNAHQKARQKTSLDVHNKNSFWVFHNYRSWVTISIWTFWNKMILIFCLLWYKFKNNFYFEVKVYNSLGFHFLLTLVDTKIFVQSALTILDCSKKNWPTHNRIFWKKISIFKSPLISIRIFRNKKSNFWKTRRSSNPM